MHSSTRRTCLLRSRTPPEPGQSPRRQPPPSHEAPGQHRADPSGQRRRQGFCPPSLLGRKRGCRAPAVNSLASGLPGKGASGGKQPTTPGVRAELARQIEQGNKSRHGEKAAGCGLKGLGHVSTKQEPRKRSSPRRPMGRCPYPGRATSPWEPGPGGRRANTELHLQR